MSAVRAALAALSQPAGRLVLLTLAALPVLLFNTFVPPWAPLAALGLLAVVAVARAWHDRRAFGYTPADWPLLLLLLTLPVGLWASADRSATLPRTYAFVANIAIFYVMAALAYAPPATKWMHWTVWALALGSLGLSLLMLLGMRFATGKLPFIDASIYSLLPGGLRPFWNARGFDPNLTGGMLGLFLPPALIIALYGRGIGLRIIAGLATVVLAAVVVLSQSRGALIGVAAALLVVTVLADRRWLLAWAVAAVGLIVAYFAVGGSAAIDLGGLVNAMLGGSGALSGAGFSGRVEVWSRALYLIEDFPFTGVGMGMFEPVVDLLYPLFLIGPELKFGHAHNIFLHAAAEMGLPGLIGHVALYGLLGFLLLRRQVRGRRGRPFDLPTLLALGLFGTLTVFLVHGMLEVVSYATRAAIIIWALFGLMMAVGLAPSEESGPM